MRRASTLLANALLLSILQAFAGPVASADRPVPDITCTTGEPATYGQRAKRFRQPVLVVLGCAGLRPGRLQIDGWVEHDRHARKTTCLDLVSAPRQQVSYACPRLRHESDGAQVLLLIRYSSKVPVLAFGVVPAEAEFVRAAYSTDTGARRAASAKLLRVRDDLAKKVGARRGFAIFIAQLGRRADVCAGIRPRAFDPPGRRLTAQRAVPTRQRVLGLPDGGWLAGFTPSWGVGLGTPTVCRSSSPTGQEGAPGRVDDAAAGAGRRAGGQPQATGGIPWPIMTVVAGVATLVALLGFRRLRVGRDPTH